MKRYLVLLMAIMVISALLITACSTTTTTTPASSNPPTTQATTSAPATSAPPASSPAAAVKTLTFSYTMPKGASVGKGFEWFGPAFEKATGGRYKVEIYPGSQLIAVPAAMDSIKSGAVEMAYTSAGTFPKQFPLSMVTQLPSLGFPATSEKMFAAGNDAFWEFYNTTPEIQNEFKDVQLVQPYVLDPYKLVSKKVEIKSAADFRGLKVGGTGGKMEIVKANGGASVQQVPPDSYLNMDKGVTDAAFITFAQVFDYHIYDIANFYSDYGFGSGNGIIIMNKEFYNSMGAADQKILADTWKQAQNVSAQGSMENNAAGAAAIEKAGKKIYVPTAAEAAQWDKDAQPSVQAWRNDAKALGATDATLDMVYNKWKSLQQKYLALGK